jgi:hypothetical protein
VPGITEINPFRSTHGNHSVDHRAKLIYLSICHQRPMEHPCYSSLNPAAEAERYTSEKVQVRKKTFIYDWLDPDRDVKSWFRRVPYRLKRGPKNRSWVVRYFEFRSGILPVPQMGFIGDLWICWDSNNPSVWFKVDEMVWERWGGCVGSVRDVRVSFKTYLRLWISLHSCFFCRR